MSASDISLTTSSDLVYNYPTSLTFTINNNNDWPKYTSLNIILPQTVLADSSVGCSYNGRIIGCSYDSATNTIKVEYFSDMVIAQNTFSQHNLIVSNVFNPTSTKQTASFQLEFLNNNKEVI